MSKLYLYHNGQVADVKTFHGETRKATIISNWEKIYGKNKVTEDNIKAESELPDKQSSPYKKGNRINYGKLRHKGG